MRRRLRQQRRMREALLLDLGALVYELHRHGRREPELLQAKAAELTAVDQEVRGLAEALDADESVLTLVAAGIAGSCDNCGSLLSTDARYCGACGAPSVPAIGGPAPSVASPALSGPAAQEPAVASRPQPRPAPEPTTEAEPQPQPEPEPQPDPEPAPEPDTQAEPQPTPEPATQAPPEPATRPESETGVQRTTEEAGGLEAQPEAQAAQAGADEQPAALEASDPPTSIHEHPYPDEPADLDGASDEPEKDEPIAPWLAEAEASKEERSNG